MSSTPTMPVAGLNEKALAQYLELALGQAPTAAACTRIAAACRAGRGALDAVASQSLFDTQPAALAVTLDQLADGGRR